MKYGKLNISVNNSKLGPSIPSVNLPPLVTCNPNAPCFKKCYARKGRFLFPNVQKTLFENWELLQTDRRAYFKGVLDATENAEYFRWHSAGDIPDAGYLLGMESVALKRPKCKFLAFTKKYDLVNKFLNAGPLPGNLTIVFSAWDGFQFENPHGLPVAYVRLKAGNVDPIPENARPCPGSCAACVNAASCWSLTRGESVVFNEH